MTVRWFMGLFFWIKWLSERLVDKGDGQKPAHGEEEQDV